MTAREVMTAYLAAARSGDWDTAFGYIRTIRDHYREGTIELELVDMLASDERVALIVRERFHGDGPPVEIRRANVYRVRDGAIVELSIFEGDQYAVDALLADVEPPPDWPGGA